MPSAIKHDHELSGKGLVSLLVESQGSNAAELESFLWKTFPDNDCRTCVNVFVPIPESPGIPFAAVIGVDGTLLWAGSPLREGQKMEALIAAELAKVKKGWGDTADMKKVRAALYGKNDIGGASALVAALPDGDAKTQLQGEVDRRYATAKKAITALQADGRWVAAQAAAKDLLKAVAAKPDWVAEVTPIVAEFDSEAGKAEIALDKKIEKIVKQLRDKKGDNAPKQLKEIVANGGDTKVAQRAQRLLTALETPVHSH